MKALILAGGKATRLRPITHTSAKQLVPIANKPILFYAIEHIRAAEITEVGFICGDTGSQIEEAIGDGSQWGIRPTFIRQDVPRGLAHAVLTGADFVADEPFVVYLGDNFILGGIGGLVADFARGGTNAHIMLMEVPNPQSFGVAELEGDRVVRLVEKPKEPKSNLALVGIYLFDSHILEACEVVCNRPPSARGEHEITDAIQHLIDRNLTVKSTRITGWWKDTGTHDDLLEANRIVLEHLEDQADPPASVDERSRLIGKVVLSDGAVIENSTLRGPLIVGARTRITDSFIGPHTSVGEDVEITASEIEHSVVLVGARIRGIPVRIADSLIGRYALLESSSGSPRVHRLTLGDHSRVDLV